MLGKKGGLLSGVARRPVRSMVSWGMIARGGGQGMREKEKVDYVQIALLSVGLSVLWPYFRLSFMTFVQGYAACSNDDVQYLFTSFVVALLMMVVLASVLHRKASQILAKPVTSLALAAIGAIGLVLLWLPLEGVAGLVVFCVGSCLCAVGACFSA